VRWSFFNSFSFCWEDEILFTHIIRISVPIMNMEISGWVARGEKSSLYSGRNDRDNDYGNDDEDNDDD